MNFDNTLNVAVNFNSATGSFILTSNDKSLSGLTSTYAITCWLDNIPGSEQTKNVDVTFIDECNFATVSSPAINPSYYELALYDYGFSTFNSVSIDPPSCFIEYQMIVISDVAYPDPLALDVSNLKIDANPMVYNDHMGQHSYIIKACVAVEGTLKNCMQSNTAIVNVFDPCLTSNILTESITTDLVASRLDSDSLSLPAEFSYWPFIDSVSASTTLANTSFLKCGATAYSVVDGDGNSPGFVYFDEATQSIVHMPSLVNPIENGTYTMYLRVTLVEYGRVVDIPFRVVINACNPVIDTSPVSIPHYFQPWGADAISLPEATAAFSQFSFIPGCDYTFSYSVFQVAPSGQPLSLPNEITFSPIDNSF